MRRLGSSRVNWYLVEEEGALTAVDAGLPSFGSTLETDLAAAGHRPDDVRAVVLTHSDADHTGVVPLLREAGATVLIHAADIETLRHPGPKSGDASPPRLVRELWRPGVLAFMGHMARNGGAKPARIDGAETFADGDLLDVPGRPRVIHTPGHTPGHCALHFEDQGLLFAGDALCTRDPVRLRGGLGPTLMPAFTNVDNRAALESLSALERLDAQALLPGHGDPWHGSMAVAVARARQVSTGRAR